MNEHLTILSLTQEIVTAHSPLNLSEQLTTILSKKGYEPDINDPEAFVWKQGDRRERLFLNYYTQANSLTLQQLINPDKTKEELLLEAQNVYTDLYKIIDELATSVGYPHLSSHIQLEFSLEGHDEQTIFQAVLPILRNLHRIKHGNVNIDVDMLEFTSQISRALLTPFNLTGE